MNTIYLYNKEIDWIFDYNEAKQLLTYHSPIQGVTGSLKLSDELHRQYSMLKPIQTPKLPNDATDQEHIAFFTRLLNAERPLLGVGINGLYSIVMTEVPYSYYGHYFGNGIRAKFDSIDEKGDFEITYYKQTWYYVTYNDGDETKFIKKEVKLPYGKSVVTNKGEKWKFYRCEKSVFGDEFKLVKSEKHIIDEHSDLEDVEKDKIGIKLDQQSVRENLAFFVNNYSVNVWSYLLDNDFEAGLFRSFEIMFRTIIKKEMEPYLLKEYFPKDWANFYKSFGKRLNGYEKYKDIMQELDDYYECQIKKDSFYEGKKLNTLLYDYNLNKNSIGYDFAKEDPKLTKKISRLCEKEGLNKEPLYRFVEFAYPVMTMSALDQFIKEHAETISSLPLDETTTDEILALILLKANKKLGILKEGVNIYEYY